MRLSVRSCHRTHKPPSSSVTRLVFRFAPSPQRRMWSSVTSLSLETSNHPQNDEDDEQYGVQPQLPTNTSRVQQKLHLCFSHHDDFVFGYDYDCPSVLSCYINDNTISIILVNKNKQTIDKKQSNRCQSTTTTTDCSTTRTTIHLLFQ